MKNKTLWIAETAVLTALLVVLQGVTASAGQLVTGSCVNAVLAVAVLTAGLWSGVMVAIISPFCAFLFGIGPQLLQLIPLIALGNVILVVVLHSVAANAEPLWQRIVGVIMAAGAKALILWLAIVKLLCQLLPLPEAQISKFSTMFSWPQFVTALMGGAVALLIVPVIQKAMKR